MDKETEEQFEKQNAKIAGIWAELNRICEEIDKLKDSVNGACAKDGGKKGTTIVSVEDVDAEFFKKNLHKKGSSKEKP